MELSKIKGIGPTIEKKLNKKGIYTINDLATFLPNRYENRKRKLKLLSLEKGTVVGEVLYINKKISNFKNILILTVASEMFSFKVVFFNSTYIERLIKLGKKYYFYGKIDYYGNQMQMVNPEFAPLEDRDKFLIISPVYPSIPTLSSYRISNLVNQALSTLDKDLRKKDELDSKTLTYKESLIELHRPTSKEKYNKALYRFIFEEFYDYLVDTLVSSERNNNSPYKKRINSLDKFLSKLDFVCTNDQIMAMKQLEEDLISSKQMRRLLQADVGAGKSVVGYYGIYLTRLEKRQSAYIAPTEVLASQQYEKIKKLFKKNVFFLSGSLKTKEKNKIKSEILNAEDAIVVGTHALFQKDVEFLDLAYIITDEQHRFGVKQREKMENKGDYPNVLMLSATPIPRTLSMILYNHLDITIIREKPATRKKIVTKLLSQSDRNVAYSHIKKEIENNRNIFIVYPFIEDNPELDVQSIEKNAAELKKIFGKEVRIIHSGIKLEDRESIMKDFYDRKFHILVATSIIEVGIDIENATIIVIESAERFGISQLHQLRGRVGRSDLQSYCYLISDSQKERLKLLEESEDGFFLSEEDLKLRGPGEIRGTRQHGQVKFKKADLIHHFDILIAVQDYILKNRGEKVENNIRI